MQMQPHSIDLSGEAYTEKLLSSKNSRISSSMANRGIFFMTTVRGQVSGGFKWATISDIFLNPLGFIGDPPGGRVPRKASKVLNLTREVDKHAPKVGGVL